MSSPGEIAGSIPLPAELDFQNPQRARENLGHIAGRLSAPSLAQLQTLLADVPDPDSALNHFQRLADTATPELVTLLAREPFLIHYALCVFSYSQYLADTLIQNPDLFSTLSADKGLNRVRSREDLHEYLAHLRTRFPELATPALLARFKKREYIRILLRDVLGIATLADTTADISALSDVLIEETLQCVSASMRDRYGPARHLDRQGRTVDTRICVLSLGKLGGSELNYSSDVDLLFLYDEGADTPGARLANREYCIRLAQEVTSMLSSPAPDGPVFRIDLRLRPQGCEGEPAISLQHAMDYYSRSAHDWELQALIKLRHSAGDRSLAREFIRSVQPYVYRGQHNFSAIETALIARRKQFEKHLTSSVRQSSPRTTDVKVAPGGIREIEFLVQCLQRVYGGRERWLRSCGTLFSLQKLHDRGHISGRDFHVLTTTYEFLRQVEHRLQLRHGQQRHHLPSDTRELEILSLSVKPEGQPTRTLPEELRQRMNDVSEIYRRIIHHQHEIAAPQTKFALLPTNAMSGDTAIQQVLARLHTDSPDAYRIACDPSTGPAARKNLHRFLSSALTTSRRYAILRENASALHEALQLFDSSQLLTDILIAHPEELASLHPVIKADAGTNLVAAASQPSFSDPVFEYAAQNTSLEQAMSVLRSHYRHSLFVSGTDDVHSPRTVYASLADTTRAAESAIGAALTASKPPAGLSIWALGRLGGREFDLLSDADLLFVRDESEDALLCSRAAERFTQILTAYTTEGTVLPVDTRLRPHGTQGDLVFTPAQLLHYLEHQAQPWEALTYTKLRSIAGPQLKALEDVWKILVARFSTAPEFPEQVRQMRVRLEHSAPNDFKVGAGGLYDIDFIIAFLAIRNRTVLEPDTMRARLLQLESAGLLGEQHRALLVSAADFFRTVEHAIRLATGSTRKSLPQSEHALQAVYRLVAACLQRDFPEGLTAELGFQMETTREIYDMLIN